MNRIRNDPDRNFHSFLFLLPKGMAFTENFANAHASPSVANHAQHVAVVMGELRVQKNVGGHPVSQFVFPGCFGMLVLHCNAASKELKSKSKVDDPVNSFSSGMKMTHQVPTPMKATQAPKKNGMQGEQ